MVREFDFYIVPTPIGNIKDITFRAVEVLREVDFIACEDTRVTQKLLNHYNISTKCISYHKYNEHERINFFLDEIQSGKKIALVSDAGTPLICDPGSVIIKELVKNNIRVTALPGACAVTTFLSQTQREGEEFTFIGFLPRNQRQIEEISSQYVNSNLVFYESPERILKTLRFIQNVRPNAKITLGRELSKLFEEVKSGTIDDVLEYFGGEIKGEIVCMIYAEEYSENIDTDAMIKKLKSKKYSDKDISTILSTLFDLNKNEVYKKSLEF